MDETEIPQYFLCPISLQIMKDPVTTVTGITYDRECIEQWLATAEDAACPVTKQPLPRDSDLTPNHILRRLIQAWCIANAEKGIDRIPTPKSPLNRSHILKLLRGIKDPLICSNSLKKLDEFAHENDRNGRNLKCMMEAGVAKAMVLFVIKCFREGKINDLPEALSILNVVWSPTSENMQLVRESFDLFQTLIWVLRMDMENYVTVKTHAVRILKMITEVASSSLLERLKIDFFKEIVNILRTNLSPQATKAVLHFLIQVCSLGRNRVKIIEAGAVFELIEVELRSPEKKTTELIFCLLANLCSCADGRAQLLKNAGGIAVVSKRILRVSSATDDRALHVLWLIAKFSATKEVISEMLSIGAVSKLCLVLQAECDAHLKKKAREILRSHSSVWNNSPCIQVYLLTRYPR